MYRSEEPQCSQQTHYLFIGCRPACVVQRTREKSIDSALANTKAKKPCLQLLLCNMRPKKKKSNRSYRGLALNELSGRHQSSGSIPHWNTHQFFSGHTHIYVSPAVYACLYEDMTCAAFLCLPASQEMVFVTSSGEKEKERGVMTCLAGWRLWDHKK